MTDPARARDLNEAARRFAETLADSYRLVYEQAQESAARQQQRAREFSELVATNLREQTEASRSGAERLSERAEEAAAFPIEGYDQMNVDEILGRLDGLSVEELQMVRDYEERGERRKTLLERMDSKIRNAAT